MKKKSSRVKPDTILPAMRKSPLKQRRHLLSRKPPRSKRTQRFKPKADEESESILERRMLTALEFYIPELQVKQQHIFHEKRRWRFDFCYLEKQVAIEMQGHAYHSSLEAMTKDYLKHNEALILGWKIMYFMSRDIDDEQIETTISIIRNVLGLNNGTQKRRPETHQADTLRRRLLEGNDFF